MRAEAVSWDDWSASNAPPIAPEDKWHVAIAPGDVKVVSLEQLDDLYRLSIVDAETKVWQDGMTEWQPLRVIAGLDDAPEPEPKRTHPRPPSPRSAPPPPRPKSVAPAPMAFAVTQPAFIAPVVPIMTAPRVPSVQPLVVSRPPVRAKRGGGFGRFLVGTALVAAASVSAYRNGYVEQAASSLHREALFEKLESSLGGPAFGTLRAVQSSTAARLELPLTTSIEANRPATETRSTPAAPAAAAAVEPPSASTPVVSLESLAPEKGQAAPVHAAAPAAAPAPKAHAPTVKAEPVAQPKPAPAPAPAAQKPASEMTERERLNAAIGQSMMMSAPTKGKSKAKGNEYDPLNPKL